MNIWSSNRYCYLRGKALDEAYDDPKILDAVLGQMKVPGKAKTLSGLSRQEKRRIVEDSARYISGQRSAVLRDLTPEEILAVQLWRTISIPDRRKAEIFSVVPREDMLLKPVSRWLKSRGLDPYKEVPMGRVRIDVLGHQPGGFFSSETLVGVELKNDDSQLKRGLDQLFTVSEYVHQIYLACTPALAIDCLHRHAEAHSVQHWDSGILERKLKTIGCGLLIVEGQDVTEVVRPREGSPRSSMFEIAKSGLKRNLLVRT